MVSITRVKTSVINGEVSGFYRAGFERVAQEFTRNFQERGEVGASVCVMVDGEMVVNLFGGLAYPASQRPWTRDTLSLVWSCTKGATAFCAHILASRGQLDLEAPVAQYWPEFAQAGKETIPVKMLLNHQAGLPAISKPLPDGASYNWDLMVNALAEQAPFWTPGTMHGYHAFTFGWLVGEIVHRVSGKSLGTFFREEIAEPLGLDFWIGLPEELEPRVAPIIFPAPPAPGDPVSQYNLAAADQSTMQFLVNFNNGGYMMPGPDGVFGFDTRAGHAAEIGAASGITNAIGLAKMYNPLANNGHWDGVTYVSRDTLARMSAVSSASAVDATLLVPSRFALGYVKSIDNRRVPGCGPDDCIILSEEAFGHSGIGGSLGFADPAAHLSFGYTMNKLGNGVGINARGQSLVDATYLSLGYRSKNSGSWLR